MAKRNMKDGHVDSARHVQVLVDQGVSLLKDRRYVAAAEVLADAETALVEVLSVVRVAIQRGHR